MASKKAPTPLKPLLPMGGGVQGLDFTSLVAAIAQVHVQSAARASRVVNMSLTLRNWVIGAYIRHYEQQGADRARYGARLLETLATALQRPCKPVLTAVAPGVIWACADSYLMCIHRFGNR